MSERTATLLRVDDLAVAYARSRCDRVAPDVVHGVTFSIDRGDTLALVGQSGSGKSTIAQAISGLLPANGRISRGTIRLDGHTVSDYDRRRWRPLRGRTIGYVPQDPLSSLDPLQRVGAQIVEAIRVVTPSISKAQALSRAEELLERVGVKNARARLRSYPHELSGGQLQRVLIAIAISSDPSFLIADEPTSALDVTVQRRILDLLDDLRDERGLGVLFITHDLALAQERSSHIGVLNLGHLVEHQHVAQIVAQPRHEYTRSLLADVPSRSPHKYAHLRVPGVQDEGADAVVRVHGVRKTFGTTRRGTEPVVALDEVSLRVRRGAVHAIVGESGSGKTTLARILAGLSSFDGGEVSVLGRSLAPTPPSYNARPGDMMLVYQNALAAVDPRFHAFDIIEEPLRIAGVPRPERERRTLETLDAVELPRTILGKRAREISGGQRQRVALARSLVVSPSVLVLDEPTSALDVSVQSQVVDLLFDLRSRLGLTYLFISHDLGLVRQIADHVTVLEGGRLVEDGAASDVFSHPAHEYTRLLLEAVPGITRRTADASAA
ncbi:ABC transporter ATP-binding protein [Microbacterium sp. SORGH_AS_0862]|uniref:dipeptide ABC transporter ATP-binding protein n=1 Tax=Microbacterium sp. SORGH_AS_0862 TaxID=3041789 RepID=UPI0027931A83|nr:ABC transporter ATP-binding protein [Microbacterium sp. SORGH_AS_0862]MDQ1205333.1 peptide/nickel transport system ATP-binding protein [Microbacterium sp. SORGH_AS_0862]